MCYVSVNKNTIATDKSALNPSGIRLGTSAMTTRGFIENDFEFVANIINDISNLIINIQVQSPSNKLVDFMKTSQLFTTDINFIKDKVATYCSKFPLPQ